jgi:hypothetical protein
LIDGIIIRFSRDGWDAFDRKFCDDGVNCERHRGLVE